MSAEEMQAIQAMVTKLAQDFSVLILAYEDMDVDVLPLEEVAEQIEHLDDYLTMLARKEAPCTT